MAAVVIRYSARWLACLLAECVVAYIWSGYCLLACRDAYAMASLKEAQTKERERPVSERYSNDQNSKEVVLW